MNAQKIIELDLLLEKLKTVESDLTGQVKSSAIGWSDDPSPVR